MRAQLPILGDDDAADLTPVEKLLKNFFCLLWANIFGAIEVVIIIKLFRVWANEPWMALRPETFTFIRIAADQ